MEKSQCNRRSCTSKSDGEMHVPCRSRQPSCTTSHPLSSPSKAGSTSATLVRTVLAEVCAKQLTQCIAGMEKSQCNRRSYIYTHISVCVPKIGVPQIIQNRDPRARLNAWSPCWITFSPGRRGIQTWQGKSPHFVEEFPMKTFYL